MNINNIDDLLINLSIAPSYKGYDYIRDIITDWSTYKRIGISKAYANLAKKYYTNAGAIERCIRHAKEIALLKCPYAFQTEIFGPHATVTGDLTNKEFLSLLTLYYEKRCKNG